MVSKWPCGQRRTVETTNGWRGRWRSTCCCVYRTRGGRGRAGRSGRRSCRCSSSCTAACARPGCWSACSALRSVESATTVRVRDDETEITDGPFAVTKEVLAGYYVLDCADLDEALRQAARLPIARYGSVEVRPVMRAEEWLQRRPRRRRRRARRGGRTTWRERRRLGRRRRARLPRGARDRARDADPPGRRLPAGRGRGAGRLRGGGHGLARATASRPTRAPGSRSPRGGGRSTACAATARWPTAPSAWPSSMRLDAQQEEPRDGRRERDRRRPAAADLHLLPPGAGPARPRGADAARARRPDDRRDRPRVPRRRADDGQADRARQAQDRRRRASPTGCPPTRSCPTGCAACCASST